MKLLIGALIGYAIVITLLYRAMLKEKRNGAIPGVEVAKDALLSYALFKTCSDDRDDLNMNYAAYDGTKLPMFSGSSTAHACTSYIVDKAHFKKGPFYTPVMEEKLNAIQKYLKKNVGTEGQGYDLFKRFVNNVEGEGETEAQTEAKTEEPKI